VCVCVCACVRVWAYVRVCVRVCVWYEHKRQTMPSVHIQEEFP